MSDIVERLRRLYESADGRCYYWAQDAADEIEKLRAERDALKAAVEKGMTLRDWFAGEVLAVFAKDYVHDNSDVIADQAYTLADAMLAAREVKP